MISPFLRRAVALAGVSWCALALPACSNEGGDSDGDADASVSIAETEPRWVYEGVLGVVTQLPIEGRPAAGLKVHHEHIPDFKDPRTGEIFINANGVPGMRAMDMDLPPADGVDISRLVIGDKVRFTLAVWDQPRQAHRVTKIEKVAITTPISFEDKQGP